MTDIKKLREVAQALEWEGGWSELLDHGLDDGTGDDKLDSLLEKFEAARDALDARWNELNGLHDLSWQEEEDEEDE